MEANWIIIEGSLERAAIRLANKGLLKPGDVLSQRIPEHDAFVSVSLADGNDVPQTFMWTKLSGDVKDLHHRIYAARPDVGAIAAGPFTWTYFLSQLDMSLPPVFDEQIRHLGVEARRIAMKSTDVQAFPELSSGANAYCLDDLALCFGMGLERLLLNVEILEKCAESFVLAQCAGPKVRRIPWLIKFIANGRLKKDQKAAATRHLSGQRSVMKAGY